MNFRFDIQMYCVVSEETDVIQEKLLDQYSFVIQHKDKQHLKIWYNYEFSFPFCKVEGNDSGYSFLIDIKENQKSTCINAIDNLICQDGLIGLNYRDAFKCMGGDLEIPCHFFDEFTVHMENGEPVINQFEIVKELISTAKHICMLIDGNFGLMDGNAIVQMLFSDVDDDTEVIFQIHDDEKCENGKLYLWLNQ